MDEKVESVVMRAKGVMESKAFKDRWWTINQLLNELADEFEAIYDECGKELTKITFNWEVTLDEQEDEEERAI